ncbi:filaggrin-2-like [Bombina bombina]|uniref:filaggrin-2-like n=1 Tax=Bombina bombina TaxID=8345 RepID=UPI00235ADAD5|nr:filaggrin-2-like [Bombina bombina]
MNSPLLECSKTISDVFNKYSKDGKLNKDQIKQLLNDHFGALIKNPVNPEVTKEILARIKAKEEEGATFEVFMGVLCYVFIEYHKGNIGIKKE